MPTALVTGARRGIGRAIALALARQGFELVLNDVAQDEAATRTLAEVRATGMRVAFLAHDVAEVAGHEAFVERAWDAFGGIDCLVNNAGVGMRVRGDLLDADPDDYDRVMGINLRGPYFLTAAVARRMVAAPAPGRSIVNLASANARMAAPDRGPYCLSKAGVSMMTSLFALRLAGHGIMVNEVRPGVIRTDMTAGVADAYTARIDAGLSPVRRWGEPEDIAAAVAVLACGQLGFVTGASLPVDGGLHIPRL